MEHGLSHFGDIHTAVHLVPDPCFPSSGSSSVVANNNFQAHITGRVKMQHCRCSDIFSNLLQGHCNIKGP